MHDYTYHTVTGRLHNEEVERYIVWTKLISMSAFQLIFYAYMKYDCILLKQTIKTIFGEFHDELIGE